MIKKALVFLWKQGLFCVILVEWDKICLRGTEKQMYTVFLWKYT